jgi:hypothetical protein
MVDQWGFDDEASIPEELMNESLQNMKQAITVATREDSLRQLFVEACSRRIDVSLLVEAK